jgi:O-antigen/teichoic acid export membrane protein
MSKVSRNIVANLVGQVFVLLMSFAGTRYVFHGLGGDALGMIIFTLTLAAVLRSVLEFGVCSLVVREVAAHRADEPDYVNDVIRTGSFAYWLGFAVLTAGIWMAAPSIVWFWIHLKSVDHVVAIRVVRILGGAAFLALPRALYASILRGLERMELNNAVDMVTSALQQCGTIAIVALGGSLVEVSCWVAGCFIASICFYLITLTQILPARAFLPCWAPSVIERNRSFSGKMMWVSMLSLAHTESDKILVSRFLPISATGYYGFAANVTNRAAIVTASIAQAAFPSLSKAISESGLNAAKSQYRKLHDLICFCTAPVFAGIAFAAPWLFTYIFDARVARTLIQPTMLLCVANYLNATLNMPYMMSLASGKPEIAVKSASMGLCITFPGSIFLVYRFGLSGAGWSWVFYQIFACLYAVPDFCEECLQMSVAAWYWHLGRILILIAGTYGSTGALLAVWGVTSLEGVTIGYLAGSTGFLIGAYALVGEELRQALLGFGRRSLKVSRALAT